MMDRETWLRRILDATRDLADESYQGRVWIQGQGPEIDSSTEALSRLLDDYDLAGFLAEASNRSWVSDKQLAALRALETALEHFAACDQTSGNDAARIARPEWRRVRAVATQTLEALEGRQAKA